MLLSVLPVTSLAIVLASATPAAAGDPIDPAPWKAIKARADTVGTCSIDEISEIEACYLLRCEKDVGLVFAIRDPGLGESAVSRVRLTIGKRHQEFAVRGTAANERWAKVSDVPALLPMLTSGRSWASLETTKAKMMYSTGFDLERAKVQIEALAKRCPAPTVPNPAGNDGRG